MQRILLDTHVFLWAITADARLSNESKRLFLSEGHALWVSAASIWEMMTKAKLGKLPAQVTSAAYLRNQFQSNRIRILPLSAEHAYQLETLPPLHRDPFDRMLVAQALAEQIPIVTQDNQIRQYAVECCG